jgi:hypothetical protein
MACGYHSCTCRGVSFISYYQHEADYCIDGKRVTMRDGGLVVTPSATEMHVEALNRYLLVKYAAYCDWHSERKTTNPVVYGDMVLQPLENYPARLA